MAWPRAAARCDLPTPGGPNNKMLVPWSSQPSPSAKAVMRALLIDETAAKSKRSRVLPAGSLASSKCREVRRRAPALAVGGFGQRRPEQGDRGKTKLAEQHRQPGGVDCWCTAHDTTSPAAREAPARAISRSKLARGGRI